MTIGVLTYLLAVIVVSGILTLIANHSPSFLENQIFLSVYWILGTVTLSIGGFIAGLIAKRRGILHGIIVALGGALLVFLYFILFMPDGADQSTLSGYLTTGVVLSGLAGGNGELIALKRHGREL